jgi:hypothetical protein
MFEKRLLWAVKELGKMLDVKITRDMNLKQLAQWV